MDRRHFLKTGAGAFALLTVAQQGKQEANAKDPVCGMAVDPAKAKRAEYRGRTYYFCSEDCKKKFENNPEKYAGKK